MTVRRCFAALTFALFILASSAIACGGSSGGNDGGPDATTEASGEGGAPILVSLSVTSTTTASPALALVPPFSPSIHDYYVRCLGATNELTVSMQANTGNNSQLVQPSKSAAKPTQTLTSVKTKANEAVVAVAVSPRGAQSPEYWVRCLPPDFPPILMTAHTSAGTPPPGYYLVGNFTATTGTGGYAMVIDVNGVPVWYHLEPKGGVCDVDNIVDGGISYIPVVAQTESLSFEQYDLAPFKETNIAPTGVRIDIHELRRLTNGNFVAISDPVETGVDLTGLSVTPGPDGGTLALGKNSSIIACDIVEFDPTGHVVWTWKALDHLDPKKVTQVTELGTGYGSGDAGTLISVFHCNSVDVDKANGDNLLVSARQTNSFFYVERSSGNILWKMGGANAVIDKGAAYIPVPSPPFNGQHDVRLQPGWSTCAGGQISLFDDESYTSNPPARALLYDVSLGGAKGCKGGIPSGSKPKATVNFQYDGMMGSRASGSFRVSSDGSRVVGWGLTIPGLVFTEVNAKGQALVDFTSPYTPPPVGPQMGSYRAVKVPITALDLTAMRNTAGHD